MQFIEQSPQSPRRRAAFRPALLLTSLVAAGVMATGSAHAIRLEVAPDAPIWQHLGAALLLTLHIGGGVIGLASGVAALTAKKGGTIHRAAGKIFLPAMFITYLIGAGVAPFLAEQQRPNFVAGILALYLLITGWRTAKRTNLSAGTEDITGFAIALAIASTGFIFMQMASNSPTGTVDGSPPEAFIVFTVAGSFAVLGELNFLIRRNLAGAARIARHLWRMCVSMFLASGSLFLGQPQVFPDWFNATPLPFLFAFVPLLAMLFWLVAVRVPSRRSTG
ncbi:MAG: hypothetical protein AAFR65_01595 [Pseudomonadota bacterium]